MATKDYNARIKNKRDSDLNWSSYNPIILNGELIITDMSNGEIRFKIGDGFSTYNELNGMMLTSNDFTDLLKSNYDNAYSHISKTNNPHNVTKSQLGLENVENKNSATIRSELTKTNVTDALGYTPPTSDTTYGAADTSLGLVKSGGDVTISSGTITVNDDSHNHVISNVDGLQSALDAKGSASDVSNLKTLVGDTSVSTQINNAIANKSDVGHTHNYAGSSSPGGEATSATKATQDGLGNNIVDTYATKTALNSVSTLVGNTAVSTQINNAVSTKSSVKIVRWS